MNNKPFMLYIMTSGMGENLLALPCMLTLSETYNLVFVSDSRSIPIFSYYNFYHTLHEIKDLHSYAEDINAKNCEEINELIKKYEIKLWCTHHEHIFKHFGKHLNAAEYKPTNKSDFVRLSYMESYAQRIGISPYQLEKYFNPPTPYSPDGKKRIVMFQGSREMLRRMPIDVFKKMVMKVYEEYKEEYQIVVLQDVSYKFYFPSDIDIVNDMIIPDVLNLFSKKVDMMIGPNGGMSVIAHLYRTPIIMLESRVRSAGVVPHFLLRTVIPYEMVDETNCLKHCEARVETKAYGKRVFPFQNIPHIPYARYKDLVCQNEDVCPCLNYGEKDIENILKILKNNIKFPLGVFDHTYAL